MTSVTLSQGGHCWVLHSARDWYGVSMTVFIADLYDLHIGNVRYMPIRVGADITLLLTKHFLSLGTLDRVTVAF